MHWTFFFFKSIPFIVGRDEMLYNRFIHQAYCSALWDWLFFCKVYNASFHFCLRRHNNCHKSWPWTSLHSPLEVTLPSHGLSHSYRSLIDCISHHSLHPHSCSQWSRLHLFTITQSHTHYINPGLSATHCRVLLAPLHTKRFPSILSLISCVLILPVLLDYSLCLALWIKFADRRPTLA